MSWSSKTTTTWVSTASAADAEGANEAGVGRVEASIDDPDEEEEDPIGILVQVERLLNPESECSILLPEPEEWKDDDPAEGFLRVSL